MTDAEGLALCMRLSARVLHTAMATLERGELTPRQARIVTIVRETADELRRLANKPADGMPANPSHANPPKEDPQ